MADPLPPVVFQKLAVDLKIKNMVASLPNKQAGHGLQPIRGTTAADLPLSLHFSARTDTSKKNGALDQCITTFRGRAKTKILD